MEAGYDWILYRSHVRRRLIRLFSMAMVATGIVLLGSSSAYYSYAQWATSRLDDLARPAAAAPPASLPGARSVAGDLPQLLTVSQALSTTRPHPGDAVPALYWAAPSAYEAPAAQPQVAMAGFQPVAPQSLAPVGTLPPATRIRIPAIGLDSPIKELAVLDLGEVRAYETPKHVVGHIPHSANGGEAGTGWFFGHLESPLSDGGAVFRSLPEVPLLRQKGQEVFVTLETEEGVQYLYRIFHHEVVPQDELVMKDLGESTIALVTCVPPLVYDHRLIVWGELVGVK